MKPSKSYRIWFSQRNGSPLLCKGLEQCGVAGKPGEYFSLIGEETLRQKHGISSYAELQQALWAKGGTPNGVFGMKHTMHTGYYQKFFAEVRALPGAPTAEMPDQEALLNPFFPNCKHIYLTRRNKIRQAVSWWKAINDNAWHVQAGKSYADEEAFYEKHYNFDALHHLFKEATLRECAIQAYFDQFNIQALTLVYEDFVLQYKETLQQVLEYLEISDKKRKLEAPYYQKTATPLSERWVQRFREDLQQNMTPPVW